MSEKKQIKINLSKKLLNLSDIPTGETMAKQVAAVLAQHRSEKGNKSIKYLDWAMDLWKNGYVEVDQADFNEFYDFVDKSDAFTVLGQGQIIKELNKIRDSKDTNKA